MTAPLVTVVIPVHNRADLLPRAIDSVLAQTWQDFEIIVVDDGSTDKTQDVIASYGDRVRCLYQKNSGAASARNLGISQGKGHYVAFLDSDDEWLPDKLQRQLVFCDNHPEYVLVFTDMREVVDNKIVSGAYLHSGGYRRINDSDCYGALLDENFIFTPTVIVRRDILDNVGGFDCSLRICEDRDLWLRIAAQYPIGFLDMPLTIRHRHGSNLTTDTELFLLSHIALYKKQSANVMNCRKSLAKLIHSKLADYYEYAGSYYLRKGCRVLAWQNFTASLRLQGTLRRLALSCAALVPHRCLDMFRSVKKLVFTREA